MLQKTGFSSRGVEEKNRTTDSALTDHDLIIVLHLTALNVTTMTVHYIS